MIGIQVRTNNNDLTQLTNDMQNLWNKLISENIAEQIQNKLDNTVYCVYTDYEGDYTKPYTAFLGYSVPDLIVIPNGLIGRNFQGGLYNKYVAKGNLHQGIVYDTWKYIWGLNTPRAYYADFEVYNDKTQNTESAEVEIFIGIKI